MRVGVNLARLSGSLPRAYPATMMRDTDPRAAAAYHELVGSMSPAQRLAQAVRLSLGVRDLAHAGLRRRHPGASEAELHWRLAALCYGRALAERAFGPGPDAGAHD